MDLGEALKEKELEGVRFDMLQWLWLMVLTVMAGSLAELLPQIAESTPHSGEDPFTQPAEL